MQLLLNERNLQIASRDLDLIGPNVLPDLEFIKRFNEKSGNFLLTFILGLGLVLYLDCS